MAIVIIIVIIVIPIIMIRIDLLATTILVTVMITMIIIIIGVIRTDKKNDIFNGNDCKITMTRTITLPVVIRIEMMTTVNKDDYNRNDNEDDIYANAKIVK